MSLDEVLDLILTIILKLLGIVLAIIFLYLLWAFLIPALGALIVALLGFLKITIFAATGVFIAVVLIILLIIILLLLDKGVPIVTAGCTLTKYTFRPDRCSTTTCPLPCIALKGPYPKLAGKLTLLSQDVGCICPSSPLSGLAPYLQKLLDHALNAKEISDLEREIEKLIPQDINDPKLDKLIEILRKLKHGEKLTEKDREDLEKIWRD